MGGGGLPGAGVDVAFVRIPIDKPFGDKSEKHDLACVQGMDNTDCFWWMLLLATGGRSCIGERLMREETWTIGSCVDSTQCCCRCGIRVAIRVMGRTFRGCVPHPVVTLTVHNNPSKPPTHTPTHQHTYPNPCPTIHTHTPPKAHPHPHQHTHTHTHLHTHTHTHPPHLLVRGVADGIVESLHRLLYHDHEPAAHRENVHNQHLGPVDPGLRPPSSRGRFGPRTPAQASRGRVGSDKETGTKFACALRRQK